MRFDRIAGLTFALLVVAGCGFGGKKNSPESSGAGSPGATYVVSVSRPVGGSIRSGDGLLECGPEKSGLDACSVTFPWTTRVTLTAIPDPGYFFVTWAGDCFDTEPCTFDMVANPGADKWAVAVFNPLDRIGHGNWMEPARHARGFFRFLAGDSTAPKCDACHGSGYDGVGIAPSCNGCHQDAGWTDWQTNCTFCHGTRRPTGGVVTDAAPPDSVQGRLTGVQGRSVGAHASHVAGTHLGHAFACEECHDHTSSPTDHVDGSAAPTFGPVGGGSLARTDGTTPSWNQQAATCTTYCHGTTLSGGGMKAPAWCQLDGTAIACNACHGAPPQSAFHPKGTVCGECHVGYTASTVDPARHVDGKKDFKSQACGSCHAMPPTANGHTTSDACGACHPGYSATVANGDIHVDGIVQVEITGESCGLCHGAPPVAPHPQLSTCGMCHDGYTATTVNATDHRNGSTNVKVMTCTSCHGSGDASSLANAAPPRGVNGELQITDRAVGAHQAHLTGITSTGLTVTGPIACAACHVVPTQVPVDLSHVGAGRATVTLGAGLGSYDANALNCTTSCHGANLTGGIAAQKLAAWTSAMTGCASCHGFPPATTSHAGVSATATACANCHSTVVSAETGDILFTDGVSKHVNGQVDEDVSHGNNGCTTCHQVDLSSSSTYQHVVTDALVSSGLTQYPARAAGAPVDGADRTCVMCHADHNLFSSNVNTSAGIDKGFNLRSSFTVAPPQIANGSTASVPPGLATIANADTALCTSCHANAQSKASGQKPDGTTVTPKVPSAEFAASGHSYTVGGSFGPSGTNDFTVNCTKCHSSPATSTRYQDGGARFALHESKDRRLLNPMGMTEADNLEEKSCYRCHSTQGQLTPGGGAAKQAAGYDYFGATTMVTSSEGVYSQMLLASPTGSAHLAGNYAGLHKPAEDDLQWIAGNKHVECADCHDPHQTRRGGQSEEWSCSGFNGSAIGTLTDANQKWVPNAFVGYVIEFYVANSATAPVRGHITANGATSLTFTNASPGSTVNRCRIAMRNNAGAVTANSAAGTSTLTSNLTWGANAFKDWTVRIVAGAGAGQSFKIVSNTTNTLTIDGTWTQALSTTAPSSKYVITRLSNTMTGAEGVDVSQWGSTWAATNAFSPAANTTTALPVAVVQWQVCFKCHSAANGKLLDTSSTWYSAQWTNVAQDFNPNNASTHPVVAPINAGATPATLLNQARLTNGWKPGDVMSCTDCHGTSDTAATAAQGPHASAVKFILRGPRTGWPRNSSGATFSYGSQGTASGPDGLFCNNCHSLSNATHHTKATHTSAACTGCHVLVPHGGKLKRLIATNNAPAPYADTTSILVRAYNPAGSEKAACSATCYSEHSASTTNAAYKW